jgi:predicted transposase YbfD/YdcC
MVSAWSARQNMVLGQVKVANKSNEITAIPRLLDMLTIKGAVVTIDALVRSTPSACGGCQRKIAAKIIEKEADYVLALKSNQGTLRDDVEEFFTEQKANEYADCTPSRHQTLEKSYGRIETRTVTVVGDIDWLKERHAWTGLASMRQGRKLPRDRRQKRTREPLLHHLAPGFSRAHRRGHPWPPRHRKRIAQGDGHGVS